VIDCTNFFLGGIKDGKFSREKILEAAGGKVTEKNACNVARSYGFGRKAENLSPALN
jgi:hypothetical protein